MKHFIKTCLPAGRFVFILLTTLGCGALYAQKQGQAKIDSLLQELPKAKEDTNKVNLLCDLSFKYSFINPDEGIKYGQQAMVLAAKLEWQKGAANANNRMGVNYYQKSDYPEALEYYQKALKIDEEIGNKNGIASVFQNTGNVYNTQGDYPKALEYYLKALKMDEEIGNKNFIAMVTGNIGLVYQTQGDYPKALEYYSKALKLDEEIGNKNLIATVTGNIGTVHSYQGDYPKALEYLFRALEMDEEIGNKNQIAVVDQNVGNVYYLLSDYPKAMEYFERALKTGEEIESKYNIAEATIAIGIVYFDQINYPKALQYFLKALKIDEEIGEKEEIANVTGKISFVYTNQKNYKMAIAYGQKALKMDEEIEDKHHVAEELEYLGFTYLSIVTDTQGKADVIAQSGEMPEGIYVPSVAIPGGKAARLHIAIDYLQRGLALAKDINVPDIMRPCYENLAQAYKLNGDYKQALESADNYHAIKDSVFSAENDKKIMLLGVQNEYDRKRVADSLKTDGKEKIARFREHFVYTGFSALVILLLAVGMLLLSRRKLKEKLEMQTAIAGERRRISADMHDDLGSGLSKISLLSELLKENIEGQGSHSHLENISRSSKELVDKMGEIVWALNTKYDKIENLIIYIRRYAMEFFNATAIQCHIHTPEHVPGITIDGELRRNIFLVVKEALHNALKHSKGNMVNITITMDENFIDIMVSDNGVGINLTGISGLGNGLNNMKKRIEDIKGKFSVKNQNGTILDFSFPLLRMV